MAADSWQQPDNMDQKLYTIRKESNKISEDKLAKQDVPKYLQNNIENVSIHMLNDDCLIHIFQFLPIKDRIDIERVCKRWRDLSQPSWYPRVKTLDISPSSTWGTEFDWFTEYQYRISLPNINNRTLHKVLLRCGQSLTRINLDNHSRNVSKSTMTIIGKLCPNLANINVTSSEVCASDIRTFANNCKNITKFELGPSTDNCDEELEYLFKLHKNLEYLAIANNHILGKCLLSLPEQTVHTIILEDCPHFQANHLSMALKKLENLKHLALKEYYNDEIGCGDVIIISEEELYSCAAEHIGVRIDEILEAIGQHCKNLKTLEFVGYYVPEETTFYDLYHLVNLQVLKMTHCSRVSDDFLIGLVQHCQQLSNIDIKGCTHVSDAGLTAIATLARLEKLNISNIHLITDDGLKNVCDLKELECRHCKFTDRGMIRLIKSSPQLQLLDLHGCENITDTVLDIAIDVCSSRTNNVMLKIIIRYTGIRTERIIDQEEIPPLLHIIDYYYGDTMEDDLDCLYDSY